MDSTATTEPLYAKMIAAGVFLGVFAFAVLVVSPGAALGFLAGVLGVGVFVAGLIGAAVRG